MRRVLFCILALFLWAESCLAGVQVIGGLARERNMHPGERFDGSLVLKNTGELTTSVRVHKTDYLFYADGRTVFDEPGKLSRSSAAWISFSPSRLSIPPKQTATVSYSIRTPENRELRGSYWAVLMIEPTETGAEKEDAPSGLSVRTLIRYAVQVIVNIDDTGERNIRILDKRLISDDGRRLLQIDIENTGERVLTPNLWAELHGEGTSVPGRLEAGKQRIYPGCTARYHIDFSKVPHGMYKALVVADNGDDYIFGARYDLLIQ